jgi:hypothetical protein
MDTAYASEFSEGTIVLGDSSVWYCTDHSTKLKVGKECPFCAHESLSPAEFEVWIESQTS